MVRLAAVAFCLALVVGCAEDDKGIGTPPDASIDLVVRVDPDGKGVAPAKELRVRCTEPGDSAACRAAERLRPSDFEPVPGETACTQIFGGAETASISGELPSGPVKGSFSKENGCEAARWEKVAALLNQVT